MSTINDFENSFPDARTYSLVVPIWYHPRSRPHSPLLLSDMPFLATVKTSPEEWRQVLCTMNATKLSGLAPVECLVSNFSNPGSHHGPDYLCSYLFRQYKFMHYLKPYRFTSNYVAHQAHWLPSLRIRKFHVIAAFLRHLSERFASVSTYFAT